MADQLLTLKQHKKSLATIQEWIVSKLTNATKDKADKNDVLLKDNSDEYVPTADYSPATKKYVDEHKADVMVGATADADGNSGLVPTPSTADKDKYLKGDGTWGTVDMTSKLDKTGGTMTGALIAQANTNYTTYQVRNIALSTSASTPTGNGSILGVYS